MLAMILTHPCSHLLWAGQAAQRHRTCALDAVSVRPIDEATAPLCMGVALASRGSGGAAPRR